MSEHDLQSKGALPLTFTVVVNEHRANGPWPVAAVEFRQDGHVALKGGQRNAAVAVPYLIEAARKAMRMVVDGELREKLLMPEGLTTDGAD